MRKRSALGGAIIAAILGATPPVDAAPQACEALASLARPDMVIAAAEAVPAGRLPQDNPARAALTGAARARAAMPAHCRVEGTINPRTGAGGQRFGTGFELRMPEEWNGKFLFQGGGGLDGFLGEAVGAIPIAGSTAPPALLRGYAVVSTDSGHRGNPATPGGPNADGSFAADQQARLDFFYQSIGDVMREARALVSARYGTAPRRSYFVGCSNGGRSAMVAAQRYPMLFDGVVAGNPAFRVSQASIALAWDTESLLPAAPRDPEGRPILANALSDADLKLVSGAVLKACDGADGLVDGLIDAPGQCRFDPGVLVCAGDKTPQCLAAAQVDALRRMFAGPKDSQGRALYASWPWDAGISAPTWRPWVLGTSQTAVPNARNTTLITSAMRNVFFTPPDPEYKGFDWDRDPARTRQTQALNDADGTLYSSFAGHGGKMLAYHGNSDPVFSSHDLTAYYERLAQEAGGMDKLHDWARLFMVPGMTHCGGGPALDDFDPLQALDAWVETGTPPARLVARGEAFPGRSRPHCPYPQEPRYAGQGSTEDAANFVCR